jgi:LysR family transcriptional regulator, glycine cleavage system transcriptional activator
MTYYDPYHCKKRKRRGCARVGAAAGQSIAICSDVRVSQELETGALMKAHDPSLPGYGFYAVHLPDHPQRSKIEAFSAWTRALA